MSKPRVVRAAVPSRRPLVTNGDSGSKGTVFLLAVILVQVGKLKGDGKLMSIISTNYVIACIVFF